MVCARAFYRNQSSLVKNPTYCSKACQNVGQTRPPVVKDCIGCGRELRLKPSQGVRQYCSRGCESLARIKRPTGIEHNGRPVKFDQFGYVMVWEPDHPNRSMKGWHYQHRLVMEQVMDRFLQPDEQVDHINRIKDDNRPENLQVLSRREHARKTGGELRADWAELAEYRRRFGPL